MTAYEVTRKRIQKATRTWVVTGAAGFIGSHLVEHLLKLEQRVIGLDNFSLGKRANLAEVRRAVAPGQWANFRFLEGDVRSLETCRRACRGADVVLHEAALGSVPGSIADPLGAHENNVTGLLNILVAAREAGVARLVYASSSATYGDHPGMPQLEPQTGRPLSPYAATKTAGELYAEVFARCYGFGSIGLRYFNVFGPRQDPEGAYAAVIPAWISALIRGEPVYINGDGTTTRDFCPVENVVQANLLAATADHPAAVNQVYNIALGEETTLSELFEIIRLLLEPRCPRLRGTRPLYRAFRPGDVHFSRACIGKARRLLGYEPAWNVANGLRRAIDWYLANLAPRQAAARTVRAEARAA
jgi:UDP-N-acetylglucosamine 4-epimerase